MAKVTMEAASIKKIFIQLYEKFYSFIYQNSST